MELIDLYPKEQDRGTRLDTYCAQEAEGITRSRAASLLKEGKILVNGFPAKASLKLAGGEMVRIELPDPEPLELVPENIPLDIVYEDTDIAVINKPRGMVVHPAPGNATGTLVQALLYHCKDLSGIGGAVRPGIVHRIDKDTTGLLVVAKNDTAHQRLTAQLADRSMSRTYLALVEGRLHEDGEVEAPIARHPQERKRMAVAEGGRWALTRYRVLENFENMTLVECHLATGRTHQIRVHMAYIGHPVVGDPVYGYKHQVFRLDGQLLHAKGLKLIHPTTGQEMHFEAPLPEDFTHVLEVLHRKNGNPERPEY